MLKGLAAGLADMGFTTRSRLSVFEASKPDEAWLEGGGEEIRALLAEARPAYDLVVSLSHAAAMALAFPPAGERKALSPPLVASLPDFAAERVAGDLGAAPSLGVIAVYTDANARRLLRLLAAISMERRLAILVDPAAALDAAYAEEFKAAAARLGVEVTAIATKGKQRAEVEAELKAARAAFIFGSTSAYYALYGAATPPLPVLSFRTELDPAALAGTGEVMGMLFPGFDCGRVLGRAAARVLMGEKPEAIGHSSAPMRLFINIAALRRFGFSVPSGVIAQADIVVR
jgi:ABC-type uncharacterized transport system substrate-binding protein